MMKLTPAPRTGATMREPDDPGAAAERRQRARWRRLLGLAVASGVATALAFAFTRTGESYGAGTLAPELTIAGAVVYVLLMVFGSYAMTRVTDEVEIHNNVVGLAAGGGALLLAYPPWWMLWRGGLVPEPTHGALFFLMFGAALAVYAWKKYR
jgi:drug/metabolite transporter (DMT)-like permease